MFTLFKNASNFLGRLCLLFLTGRKDWIFITQPLSIIDIYEQKPHPVPVFYRYYCVHLVLELVFCSKMIEHKIIENML